MGKNDVYRVSTRATQAAEKSQDYTAHKESTAPTDDQISEAIEFLHMVLEMGAPQNEWEQSAVQRILTVLEKARGVSTQQGAPQPTEPAGEPMATEESQAAMGAGVSQMPETLEGAEQIGEDKFAVTSDDGNEVYYNSKGEHLMDAPTAAQPAVPGDNPVKMAPGGTWGMQGVARSEETNDVQAFISSGANGAPNVVTDEQDQANANTATINKKTVGVTDRKQYHDAAGRVITKRQFDKLNAGNGMA